MVGIELDPEAAAVAEKWAEQVVVGDLDAGIAVVRDLEGEQFDVVTFGDVAWSTFVTPWPPCAPRCAI